MIKGYLRYIIFVTSVFGIFLCLSPTVHAQNDYWHQRVSLFEKLPIESSDIVFLGNSITDGGEFQELFGYDNVKNRGIVGDVINGVRKRLNQVTSGHPAKIFLLIGINDVSHGHTAEKIASMYEVLVKEIREQSPETQLYIQSILPINNDFRRYKNLLGREKIVPEVNALLPGIAERHGAVYVDLWPAFAGADGKLSKAYTTDGLHLSGAGYKRWAEEVRSLLDDISTQPASEANTESEEVEIASESDVETDVENPIPMIKRRVE